MIVENYVDGTPSWVDLISADVDSAVNFYCDLFGWEAVNAGDEAMPYSMCMKAGKPVAGIGPIPEGCPFPAAWTTYISVSDADAVAAAAVEAGGKVLSPAVDVGDGATRLGRMAVIADPAGGVFGIWQPDQHRGAGLVNEAGTFAWNELGSVDLAASKEFLATVFGYDIVAQDMGPDMEYFTLRVADKDVAGVMPMPTEDGAAVPSHWMTYFAVEDTDETVARAVAGGATVIGEIFDSPAGRMAALADPQGAAFSVIKPIPM